MIALLLVRLLGGFWHVKDICVNSKIKLLRLCYRKLYRLYCANFSSSIGYNTIFKNKAIFPHNIYGVFISGEAIIGKNSVIFQNVTIGSNTLIDSKGFGAPQIGDNCYIGSNAVIIGNIIIGDNVRIGANATVFQNIPSNTVVVGYNSIKTKVHPLNNRFYSLIGLRLYYYNDNKWNIEDDQTIIMKYNKIRRNI